MQRKLNTIALRNRCELKQDYQGGRSWQKETKATKIKEAANSPAVRATKADRKQVVVRVAAVNLVDNAVAAAAVAAVTANN